MLVFSRYEVNPKYVPEFESHGMKFVGRDTENVRMEIMELDAHPYYVAVQYHPEYISRYTYMFIFTWITLSLLYIIIHGNLY